MDESKTLLFLSHRKMDGWTENVPYLNILQIGLVVLGGLGIWSLRSVKPKASSNCF
jgi:hypothetical protein